MSHKKYDLTKEQHVRKQGFVQGLRTAHTLLRKAKNVHARKERLAKAVQDDDVKSENEFAAGVLHDLCLKLWEQIVKARA